MNSKCLVTGRCKPALCDSGEFQHSEFPNDFKASFYLKTSKAISFPFPIAQGISLGHLNLICMKEAKLVRGPV